MSTEVNEELRIFLIQLLRKMQLALDEYHIAGSTQLRK